MQSEPADFGGLIARIGQTHGALTGQAVRAVNISLTLRNWLIGHHIAVYELHGTDRATYGEALFESLAQRLRGQGLKRVDARELRRFRHFHACYPQMREAVTPILEAMGLVQALAWNRETTTPECTPALAPAPAALLLERLSFSHFVELMSIDDHVQRRFYEVQAVQGPWSVRELKRQIASRYFERCSLSTDKRALARVTRLTDGRQEVQDLLRDPYVFEFLGLQPRDVMTERGLEEALIDKLQTFLLELGHGFCFEARQKRLVIGGDHAFVDLVFYHRVLKCHVLVELKNDKFRHEHLGQLNTYVSWYREHAMTDGDQPPIGILLCTRKNPDLVHYALAGMNNQLFVSRYQLQLPAPEQMEAFVRDAVAALGGGEDAG